MANKLTYKVMLGLLLALGIFAWEVSIALGGSGDCDHFRNRISKQMGELHWVEKISGHTSSKIKGTIYKHGAYRNLHANVLGYVRAVIQKMTDRFTESGGDISAINLALEDAIVSLKEGRNMIYFSNESPSLEKVLASYCGENDMMALAAQIDLYIIVLKEVDRFNAEEGTKANPRYIVPVANGRAAALGNRHLLVVELPTRLETEEDFLKQRDLNMKSQSPAGLKEAKSEALEQNPLLCVFRLIKEQENITGF